jgi:hypothetical protein
MNLKLLCIAGLTLAFSCNSAHNTNGNDDSSNQLNIQINRSKNILIGIWRSIDDDKPTFEINSDSIYYIDNDEWYSYKLVSDSLIIFYTDWTFACKHIVSGDTLILINSLERTNIT